MKNYWIPIEEQWLTINASELLPFLEICAHTHNFVAEIAQHKEFILRPASHQVFVQRLLIRRLGEDLRGVELLASNGHGFQAISAAANIFEQSHFMTCASITEKVAIEYLDANNHKKSTLSVRAAVEASGRHRGWDTERIEEEYSIYRFLCGFKHNNGMMQRVLKLPRDPDLVLGQLAIFNSVRLTLTTMGMLCLTALPTAESLRAIETCNQILASTEELPEIKITSS